MATDEKDAKELDIDAWAYEVTPRYFRFKLDLADGEKYLTLDQETWEKFNRDFDNTIRTARPIDDNQLQYILQQIPNLKITTWQGAYQRADQAVMLVNIARRADGLGYILRIYEKRQDREWNITTIGEWEALLHAVHGRY